EPPELEAVTTTRSRQPTSAAPSTYVEPVAPPMVVHEPPASQRCHSNAYVIAVPIHVPWSAVSVCCATALPLIVGGAVFTARAAVTTAVGSEVAVASPASFEAVTVTRTVLPTSSERRTYARVVAPAIGAQRPASQRSHWYA